MVSKQPPDRIWLRRGTSAVLPLSELEIETVGVGDAVGYTRDDLVATAITTEKERCEAKEERLQKIRQVADLGSARELDDAIERLEAIVRIAG